MKKSILCICTLLSLIILPSFAQFTKDCNGGLEIIENNVNRKLKGRIYGDVNQDGYINMVDASLISNYYVNGNVDIDLEMADVNDDGYVNMIDASLVSRFYVNGGFVLGPTVSSTYKVIFVNYDGSIVSQQEVNRGEDATLPELENRENYVFKGWVGDYTDVQGDTVIFTKYEYSGTEPVLIVDDCINSSDGSIKVDVRIKNNPGIGSISLKLEYDTNTFDYTAIDFKKDVFGMASDADITNGLISFYMLNTVADVDTSNDGMLCSITLKVKEISEIEGDYFYTKVSVEQCKATNQNYDTIIFATQDGNIIIY